MLKGMYFVYLFRGLESIEKSIKWMITVILWLLMEDPSPPKRGLENRLRLTFPCAVL